jgi:predicted metal-dependent peptidase
MYSDDDRIGRLGATYKELHKTRSVMLHEVAKLGYPRFVDELVATAAVGETEDGRVMYYWNRAFFDSLGIRDRVYVCAHETLHLIFSHPLRRKGRDPELWNIACDVVVNTLLDHSFYLRLNNKTTKLNSRWTATQLGLTHWEVMNMTTEEVYDKVVSLHGSYAGILGRPGSGIDAHDFWETLTEEQAEKVAQAIEKHLKSRGIGRGGEMVRLEKLLVKPFPWQKLLAGRLASVKKPKEGESWVRPNRKIYNHYPRVLLPGIHEGDGATSNILISIDTSGSMSKESIEDLVALVGSLPRDEYKVHTTWFDDGVYDAPELTHVKGRGGTSFQKIEDVAAGTLPIMGDADAETVLETYPDVVVVMTDGYAPAPLLKHPARWIWILTENGHDYAVKDLGSTVWQLGARK